MLHSHVLLTICFQFSECRSDAKARSYVVNIIKRLRARGHMRILLWDTFEFKIETALTIMWVCCLEIMLPMYSVNWIYYASSYFALKKQLCYSITLKARFCGKPLLLNVDFYRSRSLYLRMAWLCTA